MSWNVSGFGKAAPLAAKLAADFERINCSEPEQTIKNAVASAVASALGAFPPNYAVRVNANGSQSCPDFSKAPKETTNQLNVMIEPLYGFVE